MTPDKVKAAASLVKDKTNRVGDILPVASVDEDGWAMLVCDSGWKSTTLPFSPADFELIKDSTRDELIQEMQAQFVKIGALLCDLESKLNLLAPNNDQRTT